MWYDYQVNPLFSLLLFVRAFHQSNRNGVGTGSFPIQSTLRSSWAHTMTCMIPEEILVPLRFCSWGLGWEEIWSLIIASWTKAVSHMCIRPQLLPCSFAVYLYILAKPKCVLTQISGDLARASDNLQELQLACDRERGLQGTRKATHLVWIDSLISARLSWAWPAEWKIKKLNVSSSLGKTGLRACACDLGWVLDDCSEDPAEWRPDLSQQLLVSAPVIWDVLTCIPAHTCWFVDQQPHRFSAPCDGFPCGFLSSARDASAAVLALKTFMFSACHSYFCCCATSTLYGGLRKEGRVYFDWQFKDTACHCVEVARQ